MIGSYGAHLRPRGGNVSATGLQQVGFSFSSLEKHIPHNIIIDYSFLFFFLLSENEIALLFIVAVTSNISNTSSKKKKNNN